MSQSTWRVLVGDVREKLAELPDGSVQCCVTSPPYWALRDYGVDGQIGMEATPELFVAALVDVFREVKRALAKDGTLWMNLGDSYLAQQGAGFNGQKRLDHANRNVKVQRPVGMKPKDLAGIPWMVAFALRADGWYLRSDIIWAKPNPMPESVTDRPTKAHEYIFLLSKSQTYFYDADAISEPTITRLRPREKNNGESAVDTKLRGFGSHCGTYDDGRNCRTVWSIATQPYPEAHFATFPEAIPERCIKAGTRVGDMVLDPFTGSGTTGQVALQLGRNFIGVELNPQYAELARRRIGSAAPLFAMEQPPVPGLVHALNCAINVTRHADDSTAYLSEKCTCRA